MKIIFIKFYHETKKNVIATFENIFSKFVIFVSSIINFSHSMGIIKNSNKLKILNTIVLDE